MNSSAPSWSAPSRNNNLLISLLLVCLLLFIEVAEAKKGKGDGSSSSSCFLEDISFNSHACETRWLITLGLFGVFVSLLVVYLLALANLSRTPWNKTMYVELDRLFGNQIQEGGGEREGEGEGEGGELPTTTTNNSRLNICERCGTSASIRELFSGRGGSIVLCAGCVGYKLMLRFMPGLMFLLPSSFLCWYFGIGSTLYLAELFSGIGMLMMVGVGLMMLIWNRPVLPFIIACRPTPDQNEEGANFQRLQRVLDPQSTQLLNSSSISESHRKSLQGILQDEEEILWIQRVPFSIFIKRHYDLQLLVWSFTAVPAMWGSIGLLSLLYERSITDIAFGVWVTIFVLVFSTPYIIAAVLKCKVTYVLTNLRAMRINSTMLFNTRVYSFPYHRMELLYILNFPDSPTSIPTTAMAPSPPSTPPSPTGEVSKGKVGWSLWPDEDSFSTLEFVANTVEVERLITRLREVDRSAYVSTQGTDFDVDTQKAQAKHFYFLQFVPLFVLPLVAIGAGTFESVKWSFLIICVLPILWCTVLFHLLFRKFNFLSNCSIRLFPFTQITA